MTEMKRILILLVIVLCTAFTSFSQEKCRAITKMGTQCKRNAVINGYCKQHYAQMNSPKVVSRPRVDLPEEWPLMSSNKARPDVMIGWRDTVTNIVHIGFKH